MGIQTPATLITLSFAGDYESCRLLCETVDRFGPPEAQHLLAVPTADLPLFRPLAGRSRTVIPEEELLPRWLRKLPLPSMKWRRRLGLPRRNVYLSFRGRPVRGWIAQQIMKFNAAAGAGTDLVLHLDSDTALVRPLPMEAMVRHGDLRLSRFPGAADDAMHAPWHRAASTLLGLPPSDYHGADYIDSLVTWRRANVRGLLSRIGEVTGRDPIAALAATRDFSEYTLYGIYCEKVLGFEAARHAPTEQSLCEMVWSEAAGGGLPEIRATAYGLGIQSTIPLSPEARRRIYEEAIARASTVAA